MTGEKESEVRKMWVSRRKWDCLLYRIKKCEDDIKIQKVNTENLIRNTAKKILEQPGELREEIQGVERIEKYIDEFIGLDEENKDRKIKKFDVLKSITREKEFSNMVFGLIEVKKTPEAFAELLEEEMPEKELPHLKEAALNGYPLFFSGMQ